MKKTMKKLLAMGLSLTMVLSLSARKEASGTGQRSVSGAIPREVAFVRISLSASSLFKSSGSEKSQSRI